MSLKWFKTSLIRWQRSMTHSHCWLLKTVRYVIPPLHSRRYRAEPLYMHLVFMVLRFQPTLDITEWPI